ncbi:MAG: hypothetical protein KY441_10795 [Actinobacteria bacterium]|nr:hypothetical protein [Actinomycetota bacterium]
MSHWDRPPEEPLPEERVVERRVAPARRRRVVTERRVRGGGFGMNPVGAILAGVLIVFILVLVFGYLL